MRSAAATHPAARMSARSATSFSSSFFMCVLRRWTRRDGYFSRDERLTHSRASRERIQHHACRTRPRHAVHQRTRRLRQTVLADRGKLALSDPLSKYGDFMRDNVFNPIGMNDSGHHEHEKDVFPRLAVGYNPKGAADVEKPPHLEWTSKTGNGSLYSTPRDLLKFCNAQILKLETLRFSQGDNPSHRGYFWFTRTRFGHPTLYISGSSPGYKAFIERFMYEDVIR